MKKLENEVCKRSECAISTALDIVGDKWSLIILRDLMFTEKRSYGELQACEEKIATNILASRLQGLEAAGIVRKTPDPLNGRRILYFLTQKGIDLLPVILELRSWAEKHYPGLEGCASGVKVTDKNRKEVLGEIMKKLKKDHAL